MLLSQQHRIGDKRLRALPWSKRYGLMTTVRRFL
jgi:hypothetical protein